MGLISWWVTRKRGRCNCHINVLTSLVFWPRSDLCSVASSLFSPPSAEWQSVSDSTTRSRTLNVASTSSRTALVAIWPLSWQHCRKAQPTTGLSCCLYRAPMVASSGQRRDMKAFTADGGRAAWNREAFFHYKGLGRPSAEVGFLLLTLNTTLASDVIKDKTTAGMPAHSFPAKGENCILYQHFTSTMLRFDVSLTDLWIHLT